jgi:Xaa-Pro aminopeptidase
VIDIGAEYAYYAADITRTYPASGTFSERQREIYQMVLDAQEFVAAHAKPGYWLKNAAYPEQSLHHMAVQFFKEHGLDKYFMHGIGHYLGLDVHDVGSYQEPLKPGDLFTIEPGLYIRNEGIGVRIEDNYLMTGDGVRCLSAHIPKTVTDIERLMLCAAK